MTTTHENGEERWRRTAALALRSPRGGKLDAPVALSLAFQAAVAQLCVSSMKSASIFILGLLVGACIAFPIAKQRSNSARPAARTIVDQPGVDTQLWQPIARESRAINYHEPLFLTNRSGEEYRLYIYGSMGAPLEFEWRSTTDWRQKGSGELFEKYEVVADRPDGVEVRNSGGRSVLMVGNHHLEWSAKDQSSGWIYFDAHEITISNESPNKVVVRTPPTRSEPSLHRDQNP